MKVAILAGGAGSRLSEETRKKPKPMVEIGGLPLIIHIMRHYAHFGFKDFAVALGYKGELIKKYMENYCMNRRNLKIDFSTGNIEYQYYNGIDWTIDLIDTGQSVQTGGRIKRLRHFIDNGTFMLTWGDGVSDINVSHLLDFHRAHGKLATLTAVRPPARYGHLRFDGDRVAQFDEKPQTAEGWINGAYFVLEPGVFDYIDGDETIWEREPLENLAKDGQLMAFKHHSFWQCMDTLREKYILQEMWATGNAPWKVWS